MVVAIDDSRRLSSSSHRGDSKANTAPLSEFGLTREPATDAVFFVTLAACCCSVSCDSLIVQEAITVIFSVTIKANWNLMIRLTASRESLHGPR
ncbi:hypothetical protein CDAR_429451 [Caerostris darwini]|uniref:Uncharacterized protein n=1 Tax=Caerostris darwini TaxID=1538125 RepID=A0AAV4WIB1_9ARAC|nr:hypothetical protein CDAR_429451 [Caerostris darwini]